MTNPKITRRRFVQTAAASLAAPAIVTAQKTEAKTVITGEGDYQYEVIHDWLDLPKPYSWQGSHNVAVDSQGLLYVTHKGDFKKKEHPSVFVFDAEGRLVRSFGAGFQGGGHGVEVRNEGGTDYVYLAAYSRQHSFAKLTTDGEILWRQGAPMESGIYAEGEDAYPRDDDLWGRDRFHPTNAAFLPDGGFVVADGYGAWRVHRYNADGEWQAMFGRPGGKKTDGTFRLPHGVWLDKRGDEPLLCVADRENDRLQWFTLGGEHRKTLDGFLWPANVDTRGDLLLVPELKGRVTLLGRDNRVLARLGDDHERVIAEKGIRGDRKRWLPGKFVHPHDACFDAEGNIHVAEWVGGARVTKLRRLA